MRLFDFSEAKQLDMKYKCRTDLYSLAEIVLSSRFPDRPVSEFPHRSMCDFFVHKEPQYSTFREFSDAYTGPKDRLILVPRKCRKSTLKIIDNIQWILCWPDMSILTMTAARNLAKAFIEEFQYYFIVKNAERNPDTKRLEGGNPNTFQLLFPEYCVTEKEASASGTFVTPARKVFTKEPTIGAFSIEMSGSGWSCDIIDFDDVLSDRNTETGEQLEGLEKGIAMATNLRKKWGFRHLVGTRYNPEDAYGHLAEANGIKELYGELETPDIKYMCMPCWWLKGKPYSQPDYKTWKPKEEDLDLFFGEDLTFKVLSKELKEQPDVFFSQSLNDPQEAAHVTFTEEIVRSAFTDHTNLPLRGVSYTAWDLAYGVKKGRDYTVGATGLLDEQGRWWITNIVRGRFNNVDLPFKIVDAIRTQQPRRICIEDTMGATWLKAELNRHAKEMNVALNIDWISLGKGTDDAKFERMSTLYSPMVQRRLFILNTCEDAEQLVKEFKSTGNRRAHNDIPDAISRLTTTYMASAAQVVTSIDQYDAARAFRELQDKEFRDMIYGQGRYEPRDPEPPQIIEYEPLDPVTGLPY